MNTTIREMIDTGMITDKRTLIEMCTFYGADVHMALEHFEFRNSGSRYY